MDTPGLWIRLGTHAEKEYVEKLSKKFDGLIVGANLAEGTPGATASLIVRLAGSPSTLVYAIDPMTYAFGEYLDRDTGEVRKDLDWIKSEQTDRKTKKKRRAFKRSYRKLGDEFGSLVDEAIQSSRAITVEKLSDSKVVTKLARQTVDYQLQRLRREFESDEELREFADVFPSPAFVIAPYFYCEPSRFDDWLDRNIRLAKRTSQLDLDVPVHATICMESDELLRNGVVEQIVKGYTNSGVNGVWLWFSRLDELKASTELLKAFVEVVDGLSDVIEVNNRHGGYFSMLLADWGMSGVAHGVGYGEQKDVIPVIGQSTPWVRYYLPDLHTKVGVQEIERCYDALGIKDQRDFYSKVCGCAICKGVLKDGIDEFEIFGESHYATPQSKRKSQTSAAAKRCRYHFLLNRIREKEFVASTDSEQLIQNLSDSYDKWSPTPLSPTYYTHLPRWQSALS